MNSTILTLQSKGQIMIPKSWRDELDTNVYQAVKEGNIIILSPIQIASDNEVKKSASTVIKKNANLLKSLAGK